MLTKVEPQSRDEFQEIVNRELQNFYHLGIKHGREQSQHNCE